MSIQSRQELRSRAAQVTGAALIVIAIMACAPGTHVLLGAARAPISPDRVKLYSTPPANFEEVAMIDASSRNDPSERRAIPSAVRKTPEFVVERLKEQAANLGANGVIVENWGPRLNGAGRAIYVPTG